MKVIVVEDNPVYNDYICNLLKKGGFDTVRAYRLSTAKKLLMKAGEENIVLADLRLPDGEGIDLLRWMRKEEKLQPFIVMTDYAEVHTAVESMKLGSADYIPKQLVEDRLVPLIRLLHKTQEQKRQGQVPIFVRQGAAYQEIKRRVRLVAPTRLGVLICGENGTGKEHIARYVHTQGKRTDKPFVAVDCGALSPTLAQSAFFGHVKGAFTGANTNKTGYVRIVAATNEDLQKAVTEKRFREDLLYRLKEYTITVPPLRDCQEDILPLAEFFLGLANKELERDIKGFNASANNILLTYPWPGNVRELKQKIQTAVLHAEGNMITDNDLELSSDQLSSFPSCFALKCETEEKERIIRALEQANGKRHLAAKLLGIGRTTLYKKMKEYGITLSEAFT